MDTCICKTESLLYSPETTMTLLTGYTPIKNVFVVKENKIFFNTLKIKMDGIPKLQLPRRKFADYWILLYLK